MIDLDPQYIQQSNQLEHFCRELRGLPRIGLDTEFIGEKSYEPSLELIQIAAKDSCGIIDVQQLESLSPLEDLLRDPSIVKIVHAGRQDIELLETRIGQRPTPIFDTQIAAAMMGYGAQIGYGALVQRVIGKKLEKSHTLTDWGRRPLSSAAITYASEDVIFLSTLHDHFLQGLTRLNRLEWVQEECARILPPSNTQNRDPRMRYLRVRGWNTLKPKALAVLRELAAWREEEAMKRNLPRGRILRDELLIELSRRPPSTAHDFRTIRGLATGFIERHGQSVLGRIKAAHSLPRNEYPVVPKSPPPEPEEPGRLDLLQTVLKACAHHASIAPTLIATSADLQTLIEANNKGQVPDVPLLHGWRRHIAGDLLWQVLNGTLTVRLHPTSCRIQVLTSSQEDLLSKVSQQSTEG